MKLSNSRDILGLIHLVDRTPHSYRRLIICSPFISESLMSLMFVAPNRVIPVPTVLISAPETVHKLSRMYKKWPGSIIVVPVPNLHAKIYLACGKNDRDSVAVIGSFNLTTAALNANFELGIRFTGNTEELRCLITILENKLIKVSQFSLTGGEKL